MLTNSFKTNYVMWLYNSDPDTSVHNIFGNYSDQGDFFANTNNYNVFICTQGGEDQIWKQIAYTPDVSYMIEEAISEIPQADWNQSNASAQNFILNKPSIPSAQIQSDWTQANSMSLDYIKNKPTIPSAQVQSDWNQSNNSIADYIKNKPSIPSAQVQSDWTQSSSGSIDFIKNKPPARSQSSVSRSLNSAFQPSSTRECLVNYSVDIATSLTLISGQSGVVFLEMASDSGFTTNVQELGRFVNGQTGTLTIGLSLSQNVTGNLSGYLPAGYYCRLRTSNTVGTPTFTYRSGQEVLL